MSGEIVVIPFPHPGHIFPAAELCRHLADRNYKITVFLPSTSFPSPLSLHPMIQTVEFFVPHPTRFPPQLMEETLPDLLAQRLNGSPTPICAIVDEMMNWLVDFCAQLRIPAVSFFTSSACSSVIEHATRNIKPADLRPGQTLSLPGLPDDMALAASDLPHREPPPWASHHGGPYPPSGPPRRHGGGPGRRGLASTSGAMALLINTCDDLERPFLDYMAMETGKPVWGVGPLLPAQFWEAAGHGSSVRDEEVRSKRESSVSERDVLQWLDSKPRGSVIYVSFGTLVSPTDEELVELAVGLVESDRPFIWVVQPERMHHGPGGQPVQADGEGRRCCSPADLARQARGRGMVIDGWAPQLLILSHPSTGAFVCHCGWNSTVEALGCGVPMLTWPVRGDQFHNAKLVTSRLGVGCTIRGADGAAVARGDVVRGIEKVMADEEIRKRAASVHATFAAGFPPTSSASMDAFFNFVSAANTNI